MDMQGMLTFVERAHKDGLSNVEIARRLEAKGYISPRTGKPISQFGVGFHVRNLSSKKAPAVILASTRKESSIGGRVKSKIDLALEILTRDDFDESLKKEIAARILNA